MRRRDRGGEVGVGLGVRVACFAGWIMGWHGIYEFVNGCIWDMHYGWWHLAVGSCMHQT